MRKPNKQEAMKQLSALGHQKRWAKRMEIINKLHSFGGIQPNYRKWSTEHLKVLLKVWKKNG